MTILQIKSTAASSRYAHLTPRYIPVSEPSIGSAELRNVVRAVRSGWVSSRGEFISRFEEAFAHYHQAPHAITTHNGTCALHLAMAAMGLGPGDEVLVPTLSFVASANTIRYCGATPVFVDSHPDYWGMDPASLTQAITPRTRAIMVVHLYGHACDMDPILEVAQKHHLPIIEDNAEGLGTFYKGRRTGTFGLVSCFSFYGNKVMTSGEGGMCVTHDSSLAKQMRILRDHGMSLEKRYWHEMIGFNYRMTNLQAAIGLAQLERLDDMLLKRAMVAGWYDRELKPLVEQGSIGYQPRMEWSTQNHWMYSILVSEGAKRRQNIIDRLGQDQIETRPFFHPIHHFPPYEKGHVFPVADSLSARGLNLPMSVRLTQREIRRIAHSLAGAFEKGLT